MNKKAQALTRVLVLLCLFCSCYVSAQAKDVPSDSSSASVVAKGTTSATPSTTPTTTANRRDIVRKERNKLREFITKKEQRERQKRRNKREERNRKERRRKRQRRRKRRQEKRKKKRDERRRKRNRRDDSDEDSQEDGLNFETKDFIRREISSKLRRLRARLLRMRDYQNSLQSTMSASGAHLINQAKMNIARWLRRKQQTLQEEALQFSRHPPATGQNKKGSTTIIRNHNHLNAKLVPSSLPLSLANDGRDLLKKVLPGVMQQRTHEKKKQQKRQKAVAAAYVASLTAGVNNRKQKNRKLEQVKRIIAKEKRRRQSIQKRIADKKRKRKQRLRAKDRSKQRNQREFSRLDRLLMSLSDIYVSRKSSVHSVKDAEELKIWYDREYKDIEAMKKQLAL